MSTNDSPPARTHLLLVELEQEEVHGEEARDEEEGVHRERARVVEEGAARVVWGVWWSLSSAHCALGLQRY